MQVPNLPLPSDSFHIAFCVDNNYFRSMGATIASILAQNPTRHFTFHVFAFAFPEDHARRLREFESDPRVKIAFHLLDTNTFEKFSGHVKSSYISLSTFSRLVVPGILKDVTDRVLYLDADILCTGSLDELASMDLSDTIALVVSDVGWKTGTLPDGRYNVLKLQHKEYFNAGVVFINIKKWEENQVSTEAIDALVKRGKELTFNDQDALNIVLNGRVRYIDKKWNYIYSMIADLKGGRTTVSSLGDAALVHFAGAIKPWNNWCRHEAAAIFKKYHALSPWHDTPLDEHPVNYKEMRIFARFLRAKGETLKSARWYASYLRKSIGRKIPARSS